MDIVHEQVRMGPLGPLGPLGLPGSVELVAPVEGLVVFAHGSGSGSNWWSRRNQRVAELLHLHLHRRSTLLLDLLTPDEATDRRKVFEEPGALETVAHQAGAWFVNHFSTTWRSCGAPIRRTKALVMMKLKVAVDGSDPARGVIDVAARLAGEIGTAEVLLLNLRESAISNQQSANGKRQTATSTACPRTVSLAPLAIPQPGPSRIVTAQAASSKPTTPPPFSASPMRAPGCWRSPASPRSCSASS